MLKLARGHAAYELSETHRDEPSHIMITPLHLLTTEARQHFESMPSVSLWPEIGSRAMERIVVGGHKAFRPGWIEVQEGLYRYLAVAEATIMIRFVVAEYLARGIVWSEDDNFVIPTR